MRNPIAWCPECGPNVRYDEDGCCATCGAACTEKGAEQAERLIAKLEAEREQWRDVGVLEKNTELARENARLAKRAAELKERSEVLRAEVAQLRAERDMPCAHLLEEQRLEVALADARKELCEWHAISRRCGFALESSCGPSIVDETARRGFAAWVEARENALRMCDSNHDESLRTKLARYEVVVQAAMKWRAADMNPGGLHEGRPLLDALADACDAERALDDSPVGVAATAEDGHEAPAQNRQRVEPPSDPATGTTRREPPESVSTGASTGAVILARREVLRFACAMEDQLRANDWKGGWEVDNPEYLLARAVEGLSDLTSVVNWWRMSETKSVTRRNEQRVRQEAADVANFVMMVVDRVGALDEDPVGVAATAEDGPPVPLSRADVETLISVAVDLAVGRAVSTTIDACDGLSDIEALDLLGDTLRAALRVTLAKG